jgi:LacI family transcriptional regulator
MKNRSAKKIGIKDIAFQAGVSIGTVDRVLHNRGEVKEETRERINQIITELGYTPNLLAKSLASKRTIRIAIVIPDSSDNNPYWLKPVQGIKAASEELSSYNVEIIYEYFNASEEQSFVQTLQNACNENPDGIVLTPVFKTATLRFIRIFDSRDIPYVFIDINIKGLNNLGYFGQDAEQSGKVAAKLMEVTLPRQPNIYIIKQTNRKVFSQHIESRIEGFMNFFKENCDKEITYKLIEIDLSNPSEPNESLNAAFNNNPKVDGIFVPNSRAYRLASFLDKYGYNKYFTIGYDLINQNIEYLKNGRISYLISQKPEEQAYKAILALFHFLTSNKTVNKTNYSAIDIIIKENIDFYFGQT